MNCGKSFNDKYQVGSSDKLLIEERNSFLSIAFL